MADAYWSNVASLLHFNAADGATTFTDQKGRTWTARGGAQIDTAQSKFGGSSLYLNGTDAAIDSPNGSDIYISGGLFTAECWFRETATATAAQIMGQHSVSGETDSSWILYSNGGVLSCSVYSGASTFTATASSSHSLDTWHHVAAVLSGGTLTLYLNGVSVGSVGSVTTPNENGVLRIGATGTTGTSLLFYFSGWVDEARLTIGVARYTGTFTPSASEFEEGSDGAIAGDVPLIAGDFVGLLVPTGAMAGDLVGISGNFGGESGAIGEFDGGLPSIAGDFPGGLGFFALIAGDIPGIGADIVGLVAQSGEFAGDLPLIAGEFIGGYSVAGTAAGDLPLISGAFAGYTAVASTIDGTLPLIAGSFVGGMATVGAIAGDLPLITGAFNDGPVGVISGSLPLISGDAPGYVGTAAAGIWLYLHTTPPAQVYQLDALRGRLNPLLPMMRVPFSVSDTAAQLGQQNDNFRVSLDRPSATLRRLLATQAPYGVRVDVMDGGTLSRTGMVSSVDAGADGFDLDCESAGWTDDLPLRTNADLGIFRDVVPLPWRYGRNVAGKCIRLGATGKRWLWADHASSRIASVAVDALPYDGWQWRNETDADGNAITVIETVDALEEGADVVATGDGAMDALSGDLMTNPADIVGDICRRGGITIDRGDLAGFRVECHARLLEIAGSITGGSLQSALVSIADSIYAAFSRSLPGLMRLRPRSSPTVTIRAADTPAGSASRDGIATRLRIRYALEDGKPRASMELRAAAVEALRGQVVAEVTLPWVTDARVADDVGGRILGDRARPRYTVRAARQQRRIVPGEVVTASVPALDLSGPALVTASAIADRGSTPTLELASGAAPAIDIVSSSIAYTPEQYTGATVTTQGNDRVIVITDDTGAPLAGAACLLDGATTRFTDGAGKVAFPLSLMPPGPHTIYVTASGFDPFTLTVVVS